MDPTFASNPNPIEVPETPTKSFEDPEDPSKEQMLSPALVSINDEKNQFIFREEEFETDQFNAAQFVAKYRRVSSLDSLREQLREYSQNLKDQLYVIINRDYKDFITIATKLDGVEDRIDHLRKPLVDLRLNLSTLHDGMVASKQAIQDKFRHKAEISTRRRLLEASLICLDQLDLAEDIISTASAPTATTSSPQKPVQADKKRRCLLRSLQLSERSSRLSSKLNSGSGLGYARARDIFECSEYERAAASLAQALSCVEALKSSVGPSSSSSSTAIAAMAAFAKNIEQRARKAVELLVLKIKNRLEDMLAIAFSVCNAKKKSEEDAAARETDRPSFPDRSFCHCIRALVALGRGSIAEKVVADAVVLPLARAALSQGRVDGTGGRGSFAGLADALSSILADLRYSLLEPFRLADSIFGICVADGEDPIPAVDLLVNGVWYPVISTLADKYPGIFSVGIADTLHRAYSAVEAFTAELSVLLTSTAGTQVVGRICLHPSLLAFHSRWKLDLYYQLRSQEILGRTDIICQSLLVGPEAHSAVVTIGDTEVALLRAAVGVDQFALPSTRAIVTELATCLHPEVMLPSQTAKFFGLVLQVLLRLQTAVHAIVTGSATEPATGKAAAPMTAVTNEDLAVLTADLEALAQWIDSFFTAYCDNILPYKRKPPSAIPTPPYYTTSPVSRLLAAQSSSIKILMLAVWQKLSSQLSAECRGALQAVKTIAGKYRMTNKPAPETASAYVKTVLQPIRAFADKNALAIPASVPASWLKECVEVVTSAYLQQVKELMETAKQMDTALQRRSKLRSTNTDALEPAAKKTALGDSEKISLQILLDVVAYGEELNTLIGDPEVSSVSYKELLDEVADARSLITK